MCVWFPHHHDGCGSKSKTLNLMMEPAHHETIFPFSHGVVSLSSVVNDIIDQCCKLHSAVGTLDISSLWRLRLSRHNHHDMPWSGDAVLITDLKSLSWKVVETSKSTKPCVSASDKKLSGCWSQGSQWYRWRHASLFHQGSTTAVCSQTPNNREASSGAFATSTSHWKKVSKLAFTEKLKAEESYTTFTITFTVKFMNKALKHCWGWDVALAVRNPRCRGIANLACSIASSQQTKTSPSRAFATSQSCQQVDRSMYWSLRWFR